MMVIAVTQDTLWSKGIVVTLVSMAPSSDREFGQIPTRLRGASGSGASAIVSLDLGDLPRDAVQKVLDRIFRS